MVNYAFWLYVVIWYHSHKSLYLGMGLFNGLQLNMAVCLVLLEGWLYLVNNTVFEHRRQKLLTNSCSALVQKIQINVFKLNSAILTETGYKNRWPNWCQLFCQPVKAITKILTEQRPTCRSCQTDKNICSTLGSDKRISNKRVSKCSHLLKQALLSSLITLWALSGFMTAVGRIQSHTSTLLFLN